ncbi:hypothetical protein BJ742DRAFT_743922 [Cladochytrium replicatum]|nr:hypothetical protein BJ742DRAFT_743922 [Cladochytrium replicatum]
MRISKSTILFLASGVLFKVRLIKLPAHPFNPKFVLGQNLTWDQVIDFPNVPLSRFDLISGIKLISVRLEGVKKAAEFSLPFCLPNIATNQSSAQDAKALEQTFVAQNSGSTKRAQMSGRPVWPAQLLALVHPGIPRGPELPSRFLVQLNRALSGARDTCAEEDHQG